MNNILYRMIFYTICVVCAAAFGLADKIMLPVTICKQSSSDYSTCLKNAMQEAWPRFVKGLPEFDFPPLEPLFYEGEKISFGISEIYAELSTSNVTVTGLSNVRFDAVRTYLQNDIFRLQVDIFKERVTFFGSYVLTGILGSIKMQKKGVCKIIEANVRETWIITGSITNDTWLVEYFETPLVDGNINVHFTDFHPKEINDLVDKFVSDNFFELYRITAPLFNKAVSPFLVDLSNRFLSKVPFSVIFPQI